MGGANYSCSESIRSLIRSAACSVSGSASRASQTSAASRCLSGSSGFREDHVRQMIDEAVAAAKERRVA